MHRIWSEWSKFCCRVRFCETLKAVIARDIIKLSSFRDFLHQITCICFLVPKRKFLLSRYRMNLDKVPRETFDEGKGKAADQGVLYGSLNKAGFYKMNKKPRGICIIINNTFAIGEAKTSTGEKLEER